MPNEIHVFMEISCILCAMVWSHLLQSLSRKQAIPSSTSQYCHTLLEQKHRRIKTVHLHETSALNVIGMGSRHTIRWNIITKLQARCNFIERYSKVICTMGKVICPCITCHLTANKKWKEYANEPCKEKTCDTTRTGKDSY